jgi:hypothetical protein
VLAAVTIRSLGVLPSHERLVAGPIDSAFAVTFGVTGEKRLGEGILGYGETNAGI